MIHHPGKLPEHHLGCLLRGADGLGETVVEDDQSPVGRRPVFDQLPHLAADCFMVARRHGGLNVCGGEKADLPGELPPQLFQPVRPGLLHVQHVDAQVDEVGHEVIDSPAAMQDEMPSAIMHAAYQQPISFQEEVLEHLATDEISIGDYILSGGELAAMVVVESVVRLLPGVLGSEASSLDDSHATGLLEYPQYTRPAVYRGWSVPEVLLSGNHAQIAKWRREQAIQRTLERRPGLLETANLTLNERQLVERLRQ